MATFVRDGIVMEIPETNLALLKACFDKADKELEEEKAKLEALGKVKYKRKEYLADNQVLELLNKVGKMVAGMSGKDNYSEQEEVVVDSLMSELEALQSQIAELKAKEEALLKELEMAQSDMSNYEEDMMKEVDKQVRDRRELERKVFPVLDMAEPEMEKLSNRQLKEALIKQRYHYTDDALQSKSKEEINAMFEIATIQSNLDNQERKIAPIPETKIVDGADPANTLALAYQEYTNRVQNAWQVNN